MQGRKYYELYDDVYNQIEELVAAGFEVVERHSVLSRNLPFGVILVRAI